MTTPATHVVGGLDTHDHTHYAAVVDEHGPLLGHREFPARDRGYAQLLEWIVSHEVVVSIGVERPDHSARP